MGTILAIAGFLIIGILLFLVLTKKASIHFSLVVVPILVALFAGFSVAELSGFMETGLSNIAQTGIMITFAILFFGIMFDAGLFDPIIKGVIKIAGGDPVKITMGTAVIAMVTHLDGSGSSTFLITVSSMLPVYRALGMSPLTLAVTAALSAGTMNMVPWGGSTLRAASVLNVNVMELFSPMLPVLAVGLAWVLLCSYWLGKQERKKIGVIKELPEELKNREIDQEEQDLKRPKLFFVNVAFTVLILACLVTEFFPLAITFIIAVPIALLINYRDLNIQQKLIENHAKGAIYTASIIFSAGIFTGILQETGMIEAMAGSMVNFVPNSWGGAFPVILAFIAMPLSLLFDPDSFYFGVLPVLAGVAENFGIEPVTMGRAAIIGQMTTGFPISPLTGSTWLLVGLAGVHIGDLQKKAIPLAFGTSVVMAIMAIMIGVI
ncbi:CitMHS family transporter [Alteribacillus sp. HJP-4]|uniref:CitMHS family transporter n=1 Tax=Alteribacillus sp. HJP-4 TaxID=2775394 RepID=UPI0035CD2BB1